MKRTVAIAACGFGLAGCSGLSMPSMPSFPLGSPPATTIQFESEPAGAEARTSTGQACRTPCSLAIAANEFTVAFTLQGFQPQTVPVRIAASTEPIDPNTPISVCFPLMATSAVMPAGWRLRLALSGADFPVVWPPGERFTLSVDPSSSKMRLPTVPARGDESKVSIPFPDPLPQPPGLEDEDRVRATVERLR